MVTIFPGIDVNPVARVFFEGGSNIKGGTKVPPKFFAN